MTCVSPFNCVLWQTHSLSIECIFLPTDKFETISESTPLDNQSILKNVYDSIGNKINLHGQEVLSKHLVSSDNSLPSSVATQKILLVGLVSEIDDTSLSVEGIKSINVDKYEINAVVTSLYGYWEQIIFRALGQLIGLGDESENDSVHYLAPGVDENAAFEDRVFHNLLFSKEPANIAKDKWRMLLGGLDQSTSMPIHRSELHPTSPDYASLQYQYSPEKIEFWEGGGGYRTQVYRSAQDCIMRRRIGDKRLPLRKTKLPLCPVCEAVFRQTLFPYGGFRTGILTYSPGGSGH